MRDKEKMSNLEALEKRIDYVVIPKLIKEVEAMINRSSDAEEKKAHKVQLDNLYKRRVDVAELLALYDAHNPG